eukprot:PhF_6_TR41275/c0_g1_i4/m.62409
MQNISFLETSFEEDPEDSFRSFTCSVSSGAVLVPHPLLPPPLTTSSSSPKKAPSPRPRPPPPPRRPSSVDLSNRAYSLIQSMVHHPNPHHFGDLPSELLIEIASYCQVFAILRLQRMNRKFHVTLKHNYLWRLFYDEILELPEIDQDQLQSLPPTHYFDATIDYHKRRFFNCPHRRYGDLIIPPIATGPTTRLEKFNNIARIFSLPILCILFGVLSVDSMIVLVLLSRAQPYIVVTRLIAFSCFTVLLIFLEGFVLQATIAPFRRDSSAHLVLRKLGTVNLITNWLCGLLYIFQLAGLIDVVWTIVACPLIINIAMQITLLALSPRDPYLRSQIGSLLWVSLAYIPVQTTAALYFFNRDAPDVIPCFIIPIPMYIQAGLLTSFSLGKFFFCNHTAV